MSSGPAILLPASPEAPAPVSRGARGVGAGQGVDGAFGPLLGLLQPVQAPPAVSVNPAPAPGLVAKVALLQASQQPDPKVGPGGVAAAPVAAAPSDDAPGEPTLAPPLRSGVRLPLPAVTVDPAGDAAIGDEVSPAVLRAEAPRVATPAVEPETGPAIATPARPLIAAPDQNGPRASAAGVPASPEPPSPVVRAGAATGSPPATVGDGAVPPVPAAVSGTGPAPVAVMAAGPASPVVPTAVSEASAGPGPGPDGASPVPPVPSAAPQAAEVVPIATGEARMGPDRPTATTSPRPAEGVGADPARLRQGPGTPAATGPQRPDIPVAVDAAGPSHDPQAWSEAEASLDQAVPGRGGLERAAPAVADAPSGTAHRPLNPAASQLEVHLARAANGRIDRMVVQLEPAHLGKVEIRLDFADADRVGAVVVVDRPETLDALQRDSAALERSLREAGFRTESGGLSFSLRRDQQEPGGHGQPSVDPSGNAAGLHAADHDLAPHQPLVRGLHLLDIQA